MNELANEFITTAQSHVGSPFRNHYRPVDVCCRGMYTEPSCMERGMDPREGFDCSGLVIGTLCELLDIPAKRWPGDMRHVRQLGWLGIAATVPRPGDIIISNPDDARLAHASISIADSRIIHASGKAGFVLAEDYPDCFANERIIPLEGLLQLVASRIG